MQEMAHLTHPREAVWGAFVSAYRLWQPVVGHREH